MEQWMCQEVADGQNRSGSDLDARTASVTGAVIIGRNEGERLRRCLDSIVGRVTQLVYVDSGSTDGSVQLARFRGSEVVELDSAVPFTAARARNAGFERLLEIQPETAFVQFVDGDCEVAEGWVEAAVSEMKRHQNAAVICGRRRERFPNASIYNRLMDMEWDTPIGEAKYCGGDALIRAADFLQVGGYDATMIAGEEPELCVRLRQRGSRILRIDREMTLHDAAMTRFSQWWKRSVRSGYSYTLGAAMHGSSADAHWLRENLSILFWGAALPVAMISLAWTTHGRSFWLSALYLASLLRVAISRRAQRADQVSDALLYASFCTIAKLPQLVGLMRYVRDRFQERAGTLIEYK